MLFQHVDFTNLIIVRNNVCCLNHGPYTVGAVLGLQDAAPTHSDSSLFIYVYLCLRKLVWMELSPPPRQSDSYGKS